MKKKILFGLAAGAFAVVAFVACKRSFEKFDAQATNAGALAECDPQTCEQNICAPNRVGTDTLRGVISTNVSLVNTKTYILDGKLYIKSGAQLTIPAGSLIKAIKKSTSDQASAIIVSRGGKINVEATETCPVIFTSNESNPQSGDWGGIVLLGKAPVNKVNPTIEGINLPSVPSGVDINYGGTDPEDNSGTLQYVRIEYAGAAIAQDNELNGLTCGGVGRGTVLDHIQVYKGNDDAFEFFGGTVNAYYLYAYVPDDDAFDFDFGYTGTIQFAVSVLNETDDYSGNPNGIELDNDGTGSTDQPYTRPILSNLTVVGVCDSAKSKRTNDVLLNAAHLRRNGRFVIRNSVFMGFPTGVLAESAGSLGSASEIKYNLVQGFDRIAYETVTPGVLTLGATNTGYRTGTSANGSIQLVAPCNYTCPDFRPATGSPAATGANFTGWTVSTDGDYLWDNTVAYKGAFAPCATVGANWLKGWTKH